MTKSYSVPRDFSWIENYKLNWVLLTVKIVPCQFRKKWKNRLNISLLLAGKLQFSLCKIHKNSRLKNIENAEYTLYKCLRSFYRLEKHFCNNYAMWKWNLVSERERCDQTRVLGTMMQRWLDRWTMLDLRIGFLLRNKNEIKLNYRREIQQNRRRLQ